MGRFSEVIEADAQRDADAEPAETPASNDAAGELAPFSMNYETERFALDAETTDQALTLLVAVTNLL